MRAFFLLWLKFQGGFEPSSHDHEEQTLIHACIHDHRRVYGGTKPPHLQKQMIDFLLSEGLNVDQEDSKGQSALMRSHYSKVGQQDVVALLEAGANPDRPTSKPQFHRSECLTFRTFAEVYFEEGFEVLNVWESKENLKNEVSQSNSKHPTQPIPKKL